jgi:hypothetical protein
MAAQTTPAMLQRKCACGGETQGKDDCDQCRKRHQPELRRKPTGNDVTAVPQTVYDVLRQTGRPLEPGIRNFMESQFVRDFSRVRVHTDPEAEASARLVNAHAYTVGPHVVFGAGSYAPHTERGARLLAHELTHVVQQPGTSSAHSPLAVTCASDPTEREADTTAERVLRGRGPVHPSWHPSALAREPADAGVGTPNRDEQVACVKQLGGCPNTRPGGIPTDDEMARYNEECRRGSGYRGEDVRPTDDECGAVATKAAPPAPTAWTPDELKTMLDTCDGGLGIWAKAKKANKDKTPTIVRGAGGSTDTSTGTITLDQTQDKCFAVQQLIQELSNLSRSADLNATFALARAGNLSRVDLIMGIERIEYETGVKNVLIAFDACKNKWPCKTTPKEWARKAKDFNDYFASFLSGAHKEHYGKWWDNSCKAAYDRKHAPK